MAETGIEPRLLAMGKPLHLVIFFREIEVALLYGALSLVMLLASYFYFDSFLSLEIK